MLQHISILPMLQHISSSTSGLLLLLKLLLLQKQLVHKSPSKFIYLFIFVSREVKDHLNYEHRVFNSEEFLKTRAIGDQPFYKKVNSVL